MARIAIDIDGVLCVDTNTWGEEEYRKREPIPEAIKKVRQLHSQGHTIILYTARHLEDEKATRAWLEANSVPFNHLILGKVKYDCMIDDKAFGFAFDWYDHLKMV